MMKGVITEDLLLVKKVIMVIMIKITERGGVTYT
jgi:cell division protein FtsL